MFGDGFVDLEMIYLCKIESCPKGTSVRKGRVYIYSICTQKLGMDLRQEMGTGVEGLSTLPPSLSLQQPQ